MGSAGSLQMDEHRLDCDIDLGFIRFNIATLNAGLGMDFR
jgi:hypothetical protein